MMEKMMDGFDEYQLMYITSFVAIFFGGGTMFVLFWLGATDQETNNALQAAKKLRAEQQQSLAESKKSK
jgi:hypothetical protein